MARTFKSINKITPSARYKTLQQESKNIQASLKLQQESYKLSQNELKRQQQMYAEKTVVIKIFEFFLPLLQLIYLLQIIHPYPILQ